MWDQQIRLQRTLRISTDSCKSRDLWVTNFTVLANINKIALGFTSKEIGLTLSIDYLLSSLCFIYAMTYLIYILSISINIINIYINDFLIISLVNDISLFVHISNIVPCIGIEVFVRQIIKKYEIIMSFLVI